ncbi:MAG: DUF938 domain-containing protein [Pseudomonadota bacterium]
MTQASFSPAADRNKHAILEVLMQLVPDRGQALEIASGTGQHAAWFAAALPGWRWQPTDAMPEAMGSIIAWVFEHQLKNVAPPLLLDVTSPSWQVDDSSFDLIYCANMLHISPWPTTAALMQGSARRLAPGGLLVTYGPYFEDGVLPSAGNLAFDESLRAQNPDWGIRRREDVQAQAALAGLGLQSRHQMPANNLLLVWSLDTAARSAKVPRSKPDNV